MARFVTIRRLLLLLASGLALSCGVKSLPRPPRPAAAAPSPEQTERAAEQMEVAPEQTEAAPEADESVGCPDCPDEDVVPPRQPQ